jgi:hypothetical protein
MTLHALDALADLLETPDHSGVGATQRIARAVGVEEVPFMIGGLDNDGAWEDMAFWLYNPHTGNLARLLLSDGDGEPAIFEPRRNRRFAARPPGDHCRLSGRAHAPPAEPGGLEGKRRSAHGPCRRRTAR